MIHDYTALHRNIYIDSTFLFSSCFSLPFSSIDRSEEMDNDCVRVANTSSADVSSTAGDDGVDAGGGGGANCCAILLASYPRHSKSFSRAFGSKMSAMKVQVRLSAEVFAVATLASQNAA